MVSLALRYGTALVVLIALDAAWLSYFAHAVFRPTLGSILLDGRQVVGSDFEVVKMRHIKTP